VVKMVHLVKLKKSELPQEWKILKEKKDSIEYKNLNRFILIHKDSGMYWFDWGVKGVDETRQPLSSTFVKNKKEIKPMLKKIMKEFKYREKD